MDRSGAASGQQADSDAAAPGLRFAVNVGRPADGSARRVEAPARLVRVWSLLEATLEEIGQAPLPPEAMSRLQRQLQEIRRELETTVSPELAGELRRIAQTRDEAPSAAGLRIECAVLTSWTGSLTIQMLSVLAAAKERLSRQLAEAGPGEAQSSGEGTGGVERHR
jgi:proteasome activator-like protein